MYETTRKAEDKMECQRYEDEADAQQLTMELMDGLYDVMATFFKEEEAHRDSPELLGALTQAAMAAYLAKRYARQGAPDLLHEDHG